ncbi:MAG TPA: FAD-dependent oxidoreductase [Geminicoccus sp.]|uniref:FAD-dependent oxidoreductase n=1 Tax=Geminicoccus sp. TaxID=2024832 RepID=UPI002C4AA62D|nr:FAD-dependent oxidoreductase [Geminicoccus sp.]HWL71636.1 FAD-dependent oxidoreductase [Geminicoccus sp.]
MTATIVIGAGIIGTTTALYLARQGLEVTVIERRDAAGLETSFANGGMLAANCTLPWSSPGTPGHLLRWLGKEEAPLLLRPRAIPAMAGWGLRFLANCRAAKYRQTSATLTAFGQKSLAEMDALLAENVVQADIWRGGFLQLHKGPGAKAEAEAAARFLEGMGAEILRLDAAGCVALEPTLAPVADTIGAGLLLKKDAWGDAQRFAAAAEQAATRAGARFRFGDTVTRIELDRGKMAAVHVGAERIPAERVVICAGPWSAELTRTHGIRLPIAPVKGYSITLMKDDIGFLPRRPIVDDFEHVVATPLGDRLRVAGTVEFDNYDRTVRDGRITNLVNGLRKLYPDLKMPAEINAWCGLRPMAADGLPVIDATGIGGLYVNTGHGAIGWTLACSSAALITDIVTGQAAPGSSPFRLGRSVW